jgi:hypothetical protein
MRETFLTTLVGQPHELPYPRCEDNTITRELRGLYGTAVTKRQ